MPALRLGLHGVVIALVALVIVRAVVEPQAPRALTIAVALLLLAGYLAGSAVLARPGRRAPWQRWAWVAGITLGWAVLVALQGEAAYLVFPLFFVYLHLLPPRAGVLAVLGTTAVAILALGLHGGWSIGGVVGPVVAALVALMIGLAFRALAAESAARQALLDELVATRGQLAASEREAGVLAERSRLAREIHDTVAQGLSSIQMLLHAAERADPGSPGVQHVRLARETAAADLAEARRFIRELSTPRLDDEGLAGALHRLAATQWGPGGLAVDVRVAPGLTAPMATEAALLRICQGAVANVLQHARARTARVTIEEAGDRVRLVVADDGVGFDPAAQATVAGSDSFGLRAIDERARQLGGTLAVRSAPGEGTELVVDLPLAPVREPADTEEDP